MALEEVSFYNTNGEEINISNIVNQMINYYSLKLGGRLISDLVAHCICYVNTFI